MGFCGLAIDPAKSLRVVSSAPGPSSSFIPLPEIIDSFRNFLDKLVVAMLANGKNELVCLLSLCPLAEGRRKRVAGPGHRHFHLHCVLQLEERRAKRKSTGLTNISELLLHNRAPDCLRRPQVDCQPGKKPVASMLGIAIGVNVILVKHQCKPD